MCKGPPMNSEQIIPNTRPYLMYNAIIPAIFEGGREGRKKNKYMSRISVKIYVVRLNEKLSRNHELNGR